MRWKFDNERPIYSQIVEQMKLSIISGYFEKGIKIPSVRELAAEAGVNPNTMQKALSELERLELIITNRTSGKFVSDNPDIIETTKKEFADSTIREFLSNMQNIGFDKEQAIELLKGHETGGKINE